MASQQLGRLRSEIDQLNLQILELLNERGRLVQEVGNLKEVQGVKRFDPVRERNMLDLIAENNNMHLKLRLYNIFSNKFFKLV